MGRKKLLRKLGEFFDMDYRARVKKKEEMKEVLVHLKQKENELRKDLEQEKKSETRQKLQQKIDIVYRQRKKGVQMLMDMREEDNNGKNK